MEAALRVPRRPLRGGRPLERCGVYGTIRTMSTEPLTPTAHLVLGLLAREGPSTPYDLKRHVGATLGHFWTFPHTLLYTEPVRLAGLGLVTETREPDGRRRRLFTITDKGRGALIDWLAEPSPDPPELRDPGLLQLFFADLGPPDARFALAARRLAIHRARLAEFQAASGAERGLRGSGRGNRTMERWRGETLQLGLLYER
jgi:PadR family transcriptional regulator, regulatory protein AphA